jgi:hypothetical protein
MGARFRKLSNAQLRRLLERAHKMTEEAAKDCPDEQTQCKFRGESDAYLDAYQALGGYPERLLDMLGSGEYDQSEEGQERKESEFYCPTCNIWQKLPECWFELRGPCWKCNGLLEQPHMAKKGGK